MRRIPGGTRGARLIWLWHALALIGLLFFLSEWKPPWELKLKGPITASLFKYGMSVGLWWGAVAHSVISVVVLATVRWWSRPARMEPAAPRLVLLTPIFWVLLGVILAGALWLRLPRMDLSYWGDEGWAARYYSHGTWKPEKGGTPQDQLTFEKVDWRKTLWDDHTGGNHYGYSAVARLALDGWRAIRGLPDHAFSEAVSRLPPLLAGLGAIVAIALFLAWLERPRAGLLAALMLTLHPWHIRYSTEARGYSLMLLFFILAVWAMMFALRDGRWRGWLIYAVAVFLTAWSWKLALAPLAVLNTVMFAAAFWKPVARYQTRRSLFSRLLIANLTAGALFLFVAGPGLAQSRYVTEDLRNSAEPMDARWVRKCVTTAFFGTPWDREHAANPVETPVREMLTTSPLTTRVAIVAQVAMLLGGMWNFGRQRFLLALALAAVWQSAVVGAAAFKYILRVEWIYWYSFYTLLPIVTFQAAALDGGMAWLEGRLNKLRSLADRPALATLLSGALLLGPAACLAVMTPQIRHMETHPFEDMRGAFQLTRGQHEPWNHAGPSNIRTCYLWRHIALYDPRANLHVRTAAELREQIAATNADPDAELYFVMAPRELCASLNPDLVAMLDDKSQFENLGRLWTERSFNSLEIFHYKRTR